MAVPGGLGVPGGVPGGGGNISPNIPPAPLVPPVPPVRVVDPPRVGGVMVDFDGSCVPWTGGSSIQGQTLAKPVSFDATRPCLLCWARQPAVNCSKRLEETEPLYIVPGSKNQVKGDITLTMWANNFAQEMTQKGMDSVFCVFQANGT